jgi:transposase
MWLIRDEVMDAMILEMAKHMAVSHIAEILDEHDTKIWRIIGKYVSTAQAIRNLSDVRKVGVDETASKRGHKYVTIFADLEEKKVIYATEGKNADTIKEFKEELPNHYAHPNNISEFSIDMSPAFIKGISENFSWASMTFDKFHVMKLINEAIDKTRREEQKENKGLKNTRFIWLKNSKKVGKDEKEYIEYLSRRNLKTARAYRIKLALEDIYREAEDKMEATKKLNKLYQWAIRSRIEAIKVFARTLKKHWLGLISYFDSRLTNGTLEGINSLVQAARTRAKGYRNIRNYITMIYLVAGKLSIDCKLYN